ncbi:MAG: tRNA uridine(34) 5-carboxymethylaminomethyl modification radical SAM/GNAT enzyme Elp3 [Patescibacteria group bacterium]|nr:tRNA uridine(34) 5-carboxymethylaminomethyl modification radical SAM/GNAT enzyme Elp3 [Patescibacteria group bacterium]
MIEAIKKLVIKAIKQAKNRDDLEIIKREFCKTYKLSAITNAQILKTYKELVNKHKVNKSQSFEKLLRKRSIRTLSGIAPVAVLTKFYPCPGNCAYCPHQKDVPVSYLSNEPAVMRAIRCAYHPYKQVVWRLKALENNGHEPTKMEVIVIGGTWSYLPKRYKYWYILNCFRAANDFNKIKKEQKGEDLVLNKIKLPYSQKLSQKKLEEYLKIEQKKNEKAKYKIIGLTLETRPDYINEDELEEMRDLGCTRIEVGVQAIDDKILDLNKRGHGVKETVMATLLMRRYGFKITYHLMPALPGSTPAKDYAMFKKIFSDSRFQPDQIKFYPTVVVKGSLLYKWFKQGKYKAYTNKQLQDLIIKCKKIVPPYVRIIRLIRDIPGESIEAGNKITNLRQIMKDRGVKCNCIRCREAKEEVLKKWQINVKEYQAAEGREFFISVDSDDNKTLYGFCRLRLDEKSKISPAIIRELHVYGELTSVGTDGKVQHLGLGKELIKKAEEITRAHKIKKISIISGVGVRDYYRKLKYQLKDGYMVKKL